MPDQLVLLESIHSNYFNLPLNAEFNNRFECNIAQNLTGKTYGVFDRHIIPGTTALFADVSSERCDSIASVLPAEASHDLFVHIDLAIEKIPKPLIERINILLTNGYYVFLCAAREPFCKQSLRYIHTHLKVNKKLVFLSINAALLQKQLGNCTYGFIDCLSGYYKYGLKHYAVDAKYKKRIGVEPDKKDFICLNYKKRTARKYILDQIKSRGIYEHGHISWGMEKTLDITENQPRADKLTTSGFIVPCFYDIAPWANSVYIELINDDVDGAITIGTKDEDYVLISEKVYRAIYNKTPFLIFAKPNVLKYLKALGYKTYDSLVDESYDDIIDWQERAQFIANELAKFCKLSDADKDAWYAEASKIAEYNYNFLMDDNNVPRVYYNRLV